jgi:hypothetical protein
VVPPEKTKEGYAMEAWLRKIVSHYQAIEKLQESM